MKQWRTINFYRRQGVTIMPGAERPFIGNVPEFAKFDRIAKSSDKPLSDANIWLL